MVKRKWKNHNILIMQIMYTKGNRPLWVFFCKEILINMVIYDIFCVLKIIGCK